MGRYSVNTGYVDAIRRAGGQAVFFPPGASDYAHLLQAVGGAMLIGGGDVDPARYGGGAHPAVDGIDPERDESELAIVRILADRGIPTLAICRGVQVVNVALGGTLHEHVPDVFGPAVPHRAEPPGVVVHEVEVERDSLLARVLGTLRCPVPSHHHEALKDLAPGLRVTARSRDGVVEAVEKPGHPWFIGVQWHPEVSAADDPVQQRLFDALVASAASSRGS